MYRRNRGAGRIFCSPAVGWSLSLLISHLLIVVWIASAGRVSAQAGTDGDGGPGERSRIQWTDDEVDMVLQADENGNVRLRDFARLLAENPADVDASPLAAALPNSTLNLNGFTTRALIAGANLSLGSNGSLMLETAPDGTPQLRLRCSLKFLRTARPQFDPTLDLDRAPDDRDGGRVAVCIHGFNGEPKGFDALRGFLRSRNVRTAAIRYDDHAGVATSARKIAALVRAKSGSSTIQWTIIGHSMGGLIGREWVENPDLDSSGIKRLITVGTPHGGSVWAEVTPLPDVLVNGRVTTDALLALMSKRSTTASAVDLRPESDFLTKLASRPRNPSVRYTTIIGTDSPIEDDTLAQLKQRAADPMLAAAAPALKRRLSVLVDQLDQTSGGNGDGVVTIDDAKIEGVDDIVTVKRTHINFFEPIEGQSSTPVWDAILERL